MRRFMGNGLWLVLALGAVLAPSGGKFLAAERPWVDGRHLVTDVRQLTFGGQNAEAYFSWDGSRIIFQATRAGYRCDQIFTMRPDGTDLRLASTGTGRTTCSFFLPGGEKIIYASTHARGRECPPPPDRSRGYVWALYDYDIYLANADGSDIKRLTDHPGYDAEGALSPDGQTIVFTSHRDGDLDIYTMDLEGQHLRRLTAELGFDGGPFFSWGGTQIVYRAYHPQTPEEIRAYQALLGQGLMRPVRAEIFVMDADGGRKRQLTRNGAANWAPAFHPNGRQVIFSSNLHAPGSRNFDLYLINVDGTGLTRLTFGGFNSFPFFSPDGRRLLFASDRGAKGPREFNIFIADWRGKG